MRKTVFAITVVSALAAAGAVAQTQTRPGVTDTPPASGMGGSTAETQMRPGVSGANLATGAGGPTSPAPNAPRALTASDFLQLPSADMLSSNLVGLDVYDGQHNNIGKIKDIAFDAARKVSAYVVAVGGFLGVGERYVAVSPDAIAVSYDGGSKTWRAAMNASKDQLKAAPEFKYVGQWNASRS